MLWNWFLLEQTNSLVIVVGLVAPMKIAVERHCLFENWEKMLKFHSQFHNFCCLAAEKKFVDSIQECILLRNVIKYKTTFEVLHL